jgi:hypothetical protein
MPTNHEVVDYLPRAISHSPEVTSVPRRAHRFAPLLCALGLVGAAGCGSAAPQPIVDPGGPFHTDVPTGKRIGALDASEAASLCADLLTAHQTFLTEAVAVELGCRVGAIDAANFAARNGDDFQTSCRAYYDNCEAQTAASAPRWTCPLPLPSCSVSVLTLSACINEIAAATPFSVCVNYPTCDGLEPGEVTPGPIPTLSALPDAPGCKALNLACPQLAHGYTCGH